ncbi:topoisomerase DNA-binding C4 zinc finger domain-containing protein [Methyloprofundus sp.]|uniref:topoisomerase DNA-binding C4 zinc finger domain-containing protein n=1 Tax=Methyloprofundus sp. TaxID=2020875 RepID=UPI003D137A2E
MNFAWVLITPNPVVKVYKAGDSCPECHHALEIRSAIRGKKIGQNYLGCSHFPECRFYTWP